MLEKQRERDIDKQDLQSVSSSMLTKLHWTRPKPETQFKSPTQVANSQEAVIISGARVKTQAG